MCSRLFLAIGLLLAPALGSPTLPRDPFSDLHLRVPKLPVRLKNTTWAEFDSFAKRGIPVVVSDVGTRWPALSEFRAEWFRATFPSEEVLPFQGADVLDPYADHVAPGAYIELGADPFAESPRAFEAHGIPDVLDPARHTSFQLAFSREELTDALEAAPYQPRVLEMAAGRRQVYKRVGAPYFLHPLTVAERRSYENLLEVWFGTGGAGTLPHIDLMENIMSTQLHGRKRWRLRVIQPQPGVETRDDMVERMGGILLRAIDTGEPWFDFEFVLEPGEMLLLPPGCIHASRTLPPEEWADSTQTKLEGEPAAKLPVAVSVSMQVDLQ